MTRRCPLCGKPLPEEPGACRPFCSWRCKLVDLGAWLDGSYRLRGPEEESEEAPQNEGEESPERD